MISSDSKVLLELAERCEAASGPDRELDRAIQCRDGHEKAQKPLEYTASLDSAMSLARNADEQAQCMETAMASVRRNAVLPDFKFELTKRFTAACLRAHAAGGEDD